MSQYIRNRSVGSPTEVVAEKGVCNVNFITEERLRSILAETLHSTIKSLVTSELKSINDQVSELHESFTFFNAKYEGMKATLMEKMAVIDALQSDNIKLNSAVSSLSYRLNMLEQNMRESNIEINGVPKLKLENLFTTVEQLTKTINAPIIREDVLKVTRVAKLNKDSKKPRAIVV
ncbi:unnamed protein product [Chilo suppressalis]|uniref:Uncharacterized protein n=1 Tax=Chilo suppressalis TaxID=168631 RepID=A0ABN8BAQ8_CHISP|nr:unnamed protein product [Chilo suppressalis]